MGSLIPNPTLRSLVVDGVFNGVGSVLVFLPQILILFLFIGILEDSGYLARAALDHGSHHGPLRAAGQELHSPAVGLCLRRAGHHGDAHHREQARPHCHHSHRPVHDVFGAAARLHVDHRRVYPGAAAARRLSRHRNGRDAGLIHARFPGRDLHGATAQIHGPQERPVLVHAGDASLPLAYSAAPWDCA